MRIVQLANWYSPTSGGLRTAIDTLGHGYAAAGHERVLVVPGKRWQVRHGEVGTLVTVPGMAVGGGYRLILRTGAIERLLARLHPDVLEVSDKYTLTAMASWAARRGVGAVLFSHERLDAVVPARFTRTGASPAARAAIRAWNQRMATRFDAVVVTSEFAEDEFSGLGVRALRRVSLGVDLELFHPDAAAVVRAERAATERTREREGARVRLAYAGRLSAEKNVGLAVAAVRELKSAGHDVHLDVYGSGAAQVELQRLADGLPIEFHGYIADRAWLAGRLADAHIVLAPCLVESFGLAVLEALACGTPVVAVAGGASGELLGGAAGIAAEPTAEGMADAVLELLARPEAQRRAQARRRAERHPWSRSISEMLDVHTTVAETVSIAGARRQRGKNRRPKTPKTPGRRCVANSA